MGKYNNYYSEDEYESWYDDGSRHHRFNKSSKKKKNFKGRKNLSEGEYWSEFLSQQSSSQDTFDKENDYSQYITMASVSENKQQQQRQHTSSARKPHQNPAAASTQSKHNITIQNVVIDFDRLANIEPVETEYEGKKTYGIKFVFAGRKQLFRIIWFNINKKERDQLYEEKYAYWRSLGYGGDNHNGK